MNGKKEILRDTAMLALGEGICTAVMIGFFVLLKQYDLSVLLGGLMGCLITVANFFFLAVVAQIATERAVAQDVDGAKKLLQTSQTYRFLAVAAVLFACAMSGVFHVLALVLPLVFQRPVLLVSEFFREKGD